MAALRSDDDPDPMRAKFELLRHMPNKDPRGNLPTRHVPVFSMDKQLSREAWASKPIR